MVIEKLEDEIVSERKKTGVPVNKSIDGFFQRDDSKVCFVNDFTHAYTVGELINCLGYTFDSVVGRKIRITIEEMKE
jgi:hypothetical protein